MRHARLIPPPFHGPPAHARAVGNGADALKLEQGAADTGFVYVSEHKAQAQAFLDFLYSPEGQTGWAEAGFRPVDTTVFDKFTADFPAPEKLWTIDDLGGWIKVNDELFDPDNGSVAKIYNKATS